jgi:DNA polymerase-3 subunit chi
MTRIDFYVLAAASDEARWRLACRLVERAYAAGERVLAWTESAADLERFDTLLWTFGDGSFVPHERLDAAAADTGDAPVLLSDAGALPAAAQRCTVLVNLRSMAAPELPASLRLIEVIDGDATRRQQGRDRFRAYRERGLAPTHHSLDNESQIANG